MNQPHPCVSSEEKFVRAMANAHTHELGFIPHTVYGPAIERGTLKLAREGADFVGFLLHGPVKHHTRIWQTFTIDHLRLRDHAAGLVHQLLEQMQPLGFERVSCWVADDLEALNFWRALGFQTTAARREGELHKRPASHLEFRFASGINLDCAIEHARSIGKRAELLRLFSMDRKFSATMTRRHRRKK